jgi:transcriptional regulator with XRE-family HTH domain
MSASPIPPPPWSAPYGADMATTFGTRLAGFRQARGLTQAQLAKAAGVSTRVLSYYENHAESASGELALAFASALGVSLDELLGAKPVKKAALLPGPGSEDLRLWKKFQQVRKLPEKDQRAVFRLVSTMTGAHDDDAASAG